MSSNGTAPVLPKSGVQDEQGSVLDRDRLFMDFGDGRVFSPYDVGPRRLDTMLKQDGKARSLEQALTLPLRQAPWSIEPADGDTGEAEFVTAALTRASNAGGMSTPIELVIAQATSACIYRRAFFEKVFRLNEDGRLVYDKVAFRPAGTCRLLYDDGTGAFQGFKQRVPTDHPKADEEGLVTIKPQRAFVFIYGQHRRPIEGVSDLETAYSLFETKQKIKFLWASFLENQVMPKAIAKDEAGSTEANKLARKVATLKGGGVVGIAQGQTVDAFETSIGAAQAFSDAIGFLDSEMASSVLAGFLNLTDSSKTGGSYALSRDQSDLFMQSRQAVLVELAASLTNWLLADLVRWNFGPRGAVPIFKFGPLLAQNIEQAITMLGQVANGSATEVPKEFIDQLVIKVAGYLDLDQGKVEQAIKDAQAQAPADPSSQLQAGVDAAQALMQAAGVPGAAPVGLTEEAYGRVDLSSDVRDLTAALRQRPRREKAPKVEVHSAPVNVTTPDVHVTMPPITVHAPPAQPNDVHVDVQPQQIRVEPHVTVERGGGFTIERDADGNVIGTQPKED